MKLDGIWFGLNPIFPIIPETGIPADHSGSDGLPTPQLPLPEDSFESNPASSSFPNSAHSPGAHSSGSQDRMIQQPLDQATQKIVKIPIAIERLPPIVLEEAYNLSLGSREDPLLASASEKLPLQVSSYDMMGRSTAKPTSGTTPAESAAQGLQKISVSPGLSPTAPPLSTPRDRTLFNRLTSAFLSAGWSNERPASPINPPNTAGTAGATADIAGATTGIAGANTGTTGATTDISNTLFVPVEGDSTNVVDLPGSIVIVNKADSQAASSLYGNANTADWPGGIVVNNSDNQAAGSAAANGVRTAENLRNMINVATAADTERIGSSALLAESAPEILLPGSVTAGTTTFVSNGGMANLAKISELPYSLYIFGNVPPRPPENPEDSRPLRVKRRDKQHFSGSSLFLRLSEAIKMACVLHSLYYGGTGLFEPETPWYGPYVRYALKNGIITAADFSDYNAFATRAETAYIFSHCVPRAALPILNIIPPLPDVEEGHPFADSIDLLFGAGVLNRSSLTGSFYPDHFLTRREAAFMIGRIATPADRKHFSPSNP